MIPGGRKLGATGAKALALEVGCLSQLTVLDLTGEECTGVGHRRWECMTAFLGRKCKGGGDHYPFVVLFVCGVFFTP